MGGDRARGAAELRQAWKPGLSQRTAFRSDSDPGHSGQAAEAGCWKELLQQLQRFRRKESSDIFTEKKNTLPLVSHCYCSWLFQSIGRKVAGSIHTSTDSLRDSSLQGIMEVQ